MMAPTYGLAEQTAELIKSQYNGTPMPNANSTSSSASGTSTGLPVQTKDNGSSNGAPATRPAVAVSFLALLAGFVAML